MRHSRIYSQNGMISDTVGYKQVIRHFAKMKKVGKDGERNNNWQKLEPQ